MMVEERMIRTQIQLTSEQARALKQIAAREGKSVAELIRIGVDDLIRRGGNVDQEELRQRALLAVGKLQGPENLAADHDRYLAEAFAETRD
jgi:hypothetical protein